MSVILADLIRDSGVVKRLNLSEVETLLSKLFNGRDIQEDGSDRILKTIKLLEDRKTQILYDGLTRPSEQAEYKLPEEQKDNSSAQPVNLKLLFIKTFVAMYNKLGKFIADARSKGELVYDENENCFSGEKAEEAVNGIKGLVSYLAGAQSRAEDDLYNEKKENQIFIPRSQAENLRNMLRGLLFGNMSQEALKARADMFYDAVLRNEEAIHFDLPSHRFENREKDPSSFPFKRPNEPFAYNFVREVRANQFGGESSGRYD